MVRWTEPPVRQPKGFARGPRASATAATPSRSGLRNKRCSSRDEDPRVAPASCGAETGRKLVHSAVGETWGGALWNLRPPAPGTELAPDLRVLGLRIRRVDPREDPGRLPGDVRGDATAGPRAAAARPLHAGPSAASTPTWRSGPSPPCGRSLAPPAQKGTGETAPTSTVQWGRERGSASAVVRVGTHRGAPRATLKTAPQPPSEREACLCPQSDTRPAPRPRPLPDPHSDRGRSLVLTLDF